MRIHQMLRPRFRVGGSQPIAGRAKLVRERSRQSVLRNHKPTLTIVAYSLVTKPMAGWRHVDHVSALMARSRNSSLSWPQKGWPLNM